MRLAEDNIPCPGRSFPRFWADLLQSKDAEKSSRAMKAMMQMDKIDIEGLKQAYDQG
jgi:hypothetical protein